MIKKVVLLTAVLFLVGCSNNSQNNNSQASSQGESSVQSQSEEEDKRINVVLLSGQSNMEGNTNSIGYITPSNGFTNEQISSINAGYDDILINYISYYKGTPNIVNKSNGFTKTELGQGNPSGNMRFGPEIGIAETLHNNGYGDKVVLIKCGIGASMLTPQANEWMGSKAPYYTQFTDLIDESLMDLEEQGYEPVIKAFCWMQGESDAGNSSYTASYASNLETFVYQFKDKYADYQEEDFRFIDAHISTSSVWTYAEQMNAQKDKFANENDWAVTIDTNAAGLQVGSPGGDQYHYNAYSEFKLGLLFGEEILNALQ